MTICLKSLLPSFYAIALMKLEKRLKGFKNKDYTIQWVKSREDNAVDKYIES